MWPADLRDPSPSHKLDRKHTSTRTAATLQGGGGLDTPLDRSQECVQSYRKENLGGKLEAVVSLTGLKGLSGQVQPLIAAARHHVLLQPLPRQPAKQNPASRYGPAPQLALSPTNL